MPRYSEDFRAGAIVTLEAAGYPDQKGALMRVARDTGVPHTTLRRWFLRLSNPPPNGTVHEKKLELVELLDKELDGIFGELPDARLDASYRDLATAAGIFIDKKQLLEGGPTERLELTMAQWLAELRNSNESVA